MFKRLCEMIGRPELLDDPRFATDDLRYANRDALMTHVTEWAGGLATADILAAAERFRLPFERVGTVADLASDPHAAARALFPNVDQPGMGPIPVARQGLNLSAHPHPDLRPAPAIGEHTAEVLQNWLGYTPEQVHELLEEAVAAPPPRAVSCDENSP